MQLSNEEARAVGQQIGVDFTKVDLDQFRRGILVELEHGSHDPETNVTNDDLATSGWVTMLRYLVPDALARITLDW